VLYLALVDSYIYSAQNVESKIHVRHAHDATATARYLRMLNEIESACRESGRPPCDDRDSRVAPATHLSKSSKNSKALRSTAPAFAERSGTTCGKGRGGLGMRARAGARVPARGSTGCGGRSCCGARRPATMARFASRCALTYIMTKRQCDALV
jgi:hypothetical protein